MTCLAHFVGKLLGSECYLIRNFSCMWMWCFFLTWREICGRETHKMRFIYAFTTCILLGCSTVIAAPPRNKAPIDHNNNQAAANSNNINRPTAQSAGNPPVAGNNINVPTLSNNNNGAVPAVPVEHNRRNPAQPKPVDPATLIIADHPDCKADVQRICVKSKDDNGNGEAKNLQHNFEVLECFMSYEGDEEPPSAACQTVSDIHFNVIDNIFFIVVISVRRMSSTKTNLYVGISC